MKTPVIEPDPHRQPGGQAGSFCPLNCYPLVYQAPFGVLRSSVEGRFLEVNPALVAMLGYGSEEELLAADLARDIYQDPAERAKLIAEGGEHLTGKELACRRKDGAPITVRLSGRRVRDEQGNLVGFEGIVEDITRHKQADAAREAAERALSESESKLRSLIENTPDILLIFDRQGTIRFANRTVPGLSLDQVIGADYSAYVATQHLPLFQQALKRAFETGEVQTRVVADFSGRWWETRLVPLVEGESVHAVMAICTDITERKRAIDLLRESEHRYRLIAEDVTDIIWTGQFERPVVLPDRLDPARAGQLAAQLLGRWRFTYVSPSVERVLGYEVAEMMPMRLEQLLSSESYARAQQFLAKELQLELQPGQDLRRSRILEVEHRAKDGRVLSVEVTATFLRSPDSRITGMLGVSRDITQRKRAENALRESEATLRGLVENMPDLVLVVNQKAVIQYVNRSTGRVSPRELVGKVGLGFLKPECQPSCREALQKAYESMRARKRNTSRRSTFLTSAGHAAWCPSSRRGKCSTR